MPRTLEQVNFAQRPINEQQVALNLAQFATDNADLNLGSDKVQNLVGTLIVSLLYLSFTLILISSLQAEAPSEVVDKMMKSERKRQQAILTPPPHSATNPATHPTSMPVEGTAFNAPASQSEKLTADQRNDLLQLQELIRRRLERNNT